MPPPTRLEKLLAPGTMMTEAEADALLADLPRADPRDVAAAADLVDFAIDRDGASATYRKLHRDRMIHDEIRFQRFAREMLERRHPANMKDAA